MNLEKMAEKYRDSGYSERNADARVCQDIVLKAIARSDLGRNVTIKGGVVMPWYYRECETRYGRSGFGFYQVFIGRRIHPIFYLKIKLS